VYDGEEITIRTRPDGDALEVEALDAAGARCATLRAALPLAPRPPEPSDYPAAPLPTEPPAASAETLAPGTVLGSLEAVFHAERAPDYLADVRETLPLYGDERIAHPGYLLRGANYLLAANVKLGPWMHVGSDVAHFGTVGDGERVRIHGRVIALYERKGHRFVEIDLLMTAQGAKPLVHVRHTAIYAPRAR
jgi:hypothetical protein